MRVPNWNIFGEPPKAGNAKAKQCQTDEFAQRESKTARMGQTYTVWQNG
jgi:hypothetical protein